MFQITLIESNVTLYFATSEAYIQARDTLIQRGVEFE